MLVWLFRRSASGKYLVGATIVASVLLLFASTAYVDRFRALTNQSQGSATADMDRSTARDRLALWAAGLEMATQQPLLGVGPGNYPAIVTIYLPGREKIAAHSSYVQMLSETGFPGLALYSAFFLGIIFMLSRSPRTKEVTWPRHAARMLQVSLVAYMVGGIFNSRHDFVLAYVLAGWAIAIHRLEWNVGPRASAGPLATMKST